MSLTVSTSHAIARQPSRAPSGSAARSLTWRIACFSVVALATVACKRKHVPVDSVDELPYPVCAAEGGVDSEIASGRLRSGPTSLEQSVVERFSISKRGCLVVLTGRQEWPMASADIEVIYDDALLPLRAWRRMTIPGSPRPDGHADIRRYEMRGPDVTIKRREPDGKISFEVLKAGGRVDVADPRPRAVIGPGRGVLTMWLRRAKLAVGGRAREVVLDFREMVEKIEVATLARDEDRFEPSLGRTVRVYTIYGRESVFADEDDVVIGDLAGMRPSASLATPEPPPLPMYGAPDPVGTP